VEKLFDAVNSKPKGPEPEQPEQQKGWFEWLQRIANIVDIILKMATRVGLLSYLKRVFDFLWNRLPRLVIDTLPARFHLKSA